MALRIWLSPYQLKSKWHPKTTSDGHEGALLKVEFSGGIHGYADLHPWPELGDANLQECLNSWKERQPNSLISRALAIAKKDAVARIQGRSLYASRLLPQSHYLLPPLSEVSDSLIEKIIADGYQCVKVKISPSLLEETIRLRQLVEVAAGRLRWRLDFNGRLPWQDAAEWMTEEAEWLWSQVDFLEDPFSANDVSQETWPKEIKQLSRRLNLENKIAFDRISLPENISAETSLLKITKPEIEEPNPAQETVFTNNLGHPFGHAVALVDASLVSEKVGGFQGLQHYTPNAWTEQFRYHGPTTLLERGTGYGFDELLKKNKWQLWM